MADAAKMNPGNIGVINPFALAEIKLGRQVEWDRIANHQAFLGHVLDFPYDRLFDPKYGSPLYAGNRFDPIKKVLVRDPVLPDVPTIFNRISEHDQAALSAGALGGGNGGGPSQQWVDAGNFFTDPAQFDDPVQGAIPDCHFISALASLAWANPYAICQRARQTSQNDTFGQGGAVDMIQFYSASGSAPANVEVTELLPLLEPGNLYQYARCSDTGETWPAIYEKAWVKWFTNAAGDQPDYTKVTGGDPVNDLVNLTGLNPTYKSTQGQMSNQIWNDVRSNCRGSWTFNPMVAWTYPSSAAAPTPIDYDTASLVAWHVYSILGWVYDGNQEYIVLRNPWGNTTATLNVDKGPWTPIEQIASGLTFSLNLPAGGVFALRADTFQQYYMGYGWVN
jgi:hypothetical protein